MRTDPPEHVPEEAKAVTRAYPAGRGQWTYDLWLVDAQSWTGLLSEEDALARLIAEGYRPARARQLLSKACSRARHEARAQR